VVEKDLVEKNPSFICDQLQIKCLQKTSIQPDIIIIAVVMLDFHSNSEMVLKALNDVNKCFKHIIYGDILKKRFIIFI